jgi:inhibitor of the pro-sigma K processing machinery
MAAVWVVAIVIVGMLVIVAASRSMTQPLRWAGQIALHFVIGACLLVLVNVLGEAAGLRLPVNPVTAGIAGFLRIPGLIALVIIKLYIM